MGKKKGKKALTVLGFAFGAGWLGGGVQFGMAANQALMAGLYGASLGSTLWSIMNPVEVPQDYGKFDQVMNTVNSESPISIIYGVRKWGGNQSYHKVENNNKRVIKDIIICEGEIEGIYDVRANDVKIGKKESLNELKLALPSLPVKYLEKVVKEQNNNYVGNCSYFFKNGSVEQSAPDNWENVGGYKNCAWMRCTLNLSEKMMGGNPTVTMLVKGKKIWVYRRVSSTQAFQWFYEWSDNPVWCTYDFMTNKRYGLGQYISPDMFDLNELIEAADYCDEHVTYYDADGNMASEKRFSLNMVIAEERNASDILGEMLSNFGGFLVWTNDKLAIRIEKEETVSYSFTDDTIMKDSFEITQTPLSETPNRYRVGFFDPTQNWTQVKVLMEDTGDQQDRGRIISKDVVLTGTTSQGQALRLSRFFRDLNRVCSLVINFATATYAMHLQCGDVINISWNGVIENMPFRILEIYDSGYGIYKIKARQYNGSIYSDDTGAEISIKDYTTIQSPLTDVVPNVSDIKLNEIYYVQKTGTVISYIEGQCILPYYPFFKQVILEYSDDDKVKWNYTGTTIDGNFIIPNVKIGSTYHVRAIVENSAGRKSEGVMSDGLIVTGKNLPPGDVKGLKFQPVSGGFLLTWESIKDPDLDGYNIYQGNEGSGIDDAKLIANKLYSTSLFVPITTTGVYAFHVVAIDTSGNMSKYPATVIATFDAPPDVVGFDAVMNGADLDFRWQPIAQSGIRYEIRRGDAWGFGELIGKTANPYYRTLFPTAGSHEFWIKALDAYGNYSENAAKANILSPSQNSRNIVEVYDEQLNGWKGAKINFDIVDGGLKMKPMAVRGVYIAKISLPNKFLARNWIESHITGIVGQEIAWDMATFTWDSLEANSPWKSSADIDGTILKHQIAYWKGLDSNIIESISFDGTTTGERGLKPSEAKGIIYEEGRFADGVKINDISRLAYSVNIPSTFSTVFNIKVEDMANSAVYLTLVGERGKLWVGYESKKNVFFLKDDTQRVIEAHCPAAHIDYVTVGVSQTLTTRKLFIKVYSSDSAVSATGDYAPIGSFTAIYLYPYQYV